MTPICTTALIVMNLAASNMTEVHRQITCVQPQVKIVNFLKVQEDRRRLVNVKRIRNMKIKGRG